MMKGPLKVKYVVKMTIMTGLFVLIILIKVSSELKNLNKLAASISIEQKVKIGEQFGLQSLHKIEIDSRYAMF